MWVSDQTTETNIQVNYISHFNDKYYFSVGECDSSLITNNTTFLLNTKMVKIMSDYICCHMFTYTAIPFIW